MPRITDLLEERRATLGLSAVAFLKKLNFPKSDASRYSKVKAGKLPFPRVWVPQAAKFLGVTAEELLALEKGHELTRNSERKFSADQLRKFAEIVELVGNPLTLDTLVRIAAEIKTAASP